MYIISVMIKIRNIEQPVWFLFKKSNDDGPDIYIGEIKSYAQYLDVRVQIREAQESGYYLICGDETVRLDRNGTEDNVPDDLFGEIEVNLLLKLI